ncbi:hypothetical protein PR048_027841 [Dryococelus australis]|uniref:Uncharacterized protein n=1 Tax=Dryococelus australis TaxID=614101 RepID=A0ABQ9GHN5_9NEOP|nr:hypothetical protein PR048_027841 [Dryococelus australis]
MSTCLLHPSKLWAEQLPKFEGRVGEKPIIFLIKLEEYAALLGLIDCDRLRCLNLALTSTADNWWEVARRGGLDQEDKQASEGDSSMEDRNLESPKSPGKRPASGQSSPSDGMNDRTNTAEHTPCKQGNVAPLVQPFPMQFSFSPPNSVVMYNQALPGYVNQQKPVYFENQRPSDPRLPVFTPAQLDTSCVNTNSVGQEQNGCSHKSTYYQAISPYSLGAVVSERLTCSPSNRANRVQLCRTMPLVAVGLLDSQLGKPGTITAFGNSAKDAAGRRVFSGICRLHRPFTSLYLRKIGGNGRSPRKPADQRHRPARFPYAKVGVTRPGIEPGRPWWEASILTPQPPVTPETLHALRVREMRRYKCVLVSPVSPPHFLTLDAQLHPALKSCVSLMNSHSTRIIKIVNAKFRLRQLQMLEATLAERLECSPPTKANWVLSPARRHIGFLVSGNRVGRCRWSAGFLRVLPFPPPLHYSAAPLSTHFTLIGCQDLAVRSHPNLSTHLLDDVPTAYLSYPRWGSGQANLQVLPPTRRTIVVQLFPSPGRIGPTLADLPSLKLQRRYYGLMELLLALGSMDARFVRAHALCAALHEVEVGNFLWQFLSSPPDLPSLLPQEATIPRSLSCSGGGGGRSAPHLASRQRLCAAVVSLPTCRPRYCVPAKVCQLPAVAVASNASAQNTKEYRDGTHRLKMSRKAKSKFINRIRLERASQEQFSDTHKTPYDLVKRCRELNADKPSERQRRVGYQPRRRIQNTSQILKHSFGAPVVLSSQRHAPYTRLTLQQHVITLFTNQRLVIHPPADSPANRKFFATRNNQSDTRSVPELHAPNQSRIKRTVPAFASEIGKFREFNDLQARLLSPMHTRAPAVCSLAATPESCQCSTTPDSVGFATSFLAMAFHESATGAAVVEWSDYSSHTKVSRDRLLEGSDFGTRDPFRMMPLVSSFPRGSPVYPALASRLYSFLISFHPHRISRPRC